MHHQRNTPGLHQVSQADSAASFFRSQLRAPRARTGGIRTRLSFHGC